MLLRKQESDKSAFQSRGGTGEGKDHLGDEVAHIGQHSPSSQVDFPVTRGDEFLVESQVLCSTLPGYTQLVQVTAPETGHP